MKDASKKERCEKGKKGEQDEIERRKGDKRYRGGKRRKKEELRKEKRKIWKEKQK